IPRTESENNPTTGGHGHPQCWDGLRAYRIIWDESVPGSQGNGPARGGGAIGRLRRTICRGLHLRTLDIRHQQLAIALFDRHGWLLRWWHHHGPPDFPTSILIIT